MKRSSLAWRIFWATVIILLWFWEGCIWYNRTRLAFRPDPHVASKTFWEKVAVPEDVEAAIPEPSTVDEDLLSGKVATDLYSQQLIGVAADPAKSHVTLACDIAALDLLCKREPERLRRYLACNPGWRFATTGGRDSASRRVLKSGQWHAQDWRVVFHGEKPDGDFFVNSIESQSVIDIGGFDFYGTKCKSGDSVRLDAEPKDEGETDCEVVCCGECLTLDVVEFSSFPTCRVMQSVFDMTKIEFEKVVNATNWAMLKRTLPEGAIRQGPESLELFEQRTSDGEVMGYTYNAWVNSREQGEVYLKAFEITQGIELGFGTEGSPSDLMRHTREYAGWSDDPKETYLVGCRISFPGSRRKSFAVRLEVWFIPANGGPERKLIERVFKVKGGER